MLIPNLIEVIRIVDDIIKYTCILILLTFPLHGLTLLSLKNAVVVYLCFFMCISHSLAY